MTLQQESTTQEVLAGLVERVTFHNADSGFCVLRIKARSHRDLVTVVGHAATISPGEWVTASGEWINDRTHGQQFKARFMRTSEPTSIDGIEKYLGSGMIRGIGPVFAKKMVKAFGEKVFDIIEAEPDRLREVTGIGAVRAKRITEAWADQKIVREIMVFLHSHGVGTARAVRIFKTYGADAVQVMTENPYRLARDIRGIGFKTADAIAMKLGIEKTAMIRVRAGISYALTEAMDEGHCGLPADVLVPSTIELLGVQKELVQTALALELAERTVVADTVGETACVFLSGLYRAEQSLPSVCCVWQTALCRGPTSTRKRRSLGSRPGLALRLPTARPRRFAWLCCRRCLSLREDQESAKRPSSTRSCAFSQRRTSTCSSAPRPAGRPSA
jgi:exodeoxyribonuclease V alpha subunit